MRIPYTRDPKPTPSTPPPLNPHPPKPHSGTANESEATGYEPSYAPRAKGEGGGQRTSHSARSVFPRATVTIRHQPSPHFLPIQVQQTERVVGTHPSFGKKCMYTITHTINHQPSLQPPETLRPNPFRCSKRREWSAHTPRSARSVCPHWIARLTYLLGQWLQCQDNGSNVCRVLRPTINRHHQPSTLTPLPPNTGPANGESCRRTPPVWEGVCAPLPTPSTMNRHPNPLNLCALTPSGAANGARGRGTPIVREGVCVHHRADKPHVQCCCLRRPARQTFHSTPSTPKLSSLRAGQTRNPQS